MMWAEYWYEFRPLPHDFNQPKIVLWKMQMCNSESLGMGEIDLPVRVYIGMNLGCCHMILAIEKYTSENISK